MGLQAIELFTFQYFYQNLRLAVVLFGPQLKGIEQRTCPIKRTGGQPEVTY